MDDFNFNMNIDFNFDNIVSEAGDAAESILTNPELLTDEDIEEMSLGNVPKNTKLKRLWALRHFSAWRLKRNSLLPENKRISYKEIHEFTVEELNWCVTRFIGEVRDKSGNRFRPKTLKELVLQLQQGINVKLKGENYSFLSDGRFKAIAGCLDSVMGNNAKLGLNVPTKHAENITTSQEDKLWEDNILGCQCPSQLLTTLVFTIGLNFALRGGSEHSNLTIDQFSIEERENKKILIYREKYSKNHTGTLKDINSDIKEVKAFPHSINNRSPALIFEKYLQHRPPGLKRLYLRPLKNPKGELWYCEQPVGIHKIEEIVKTAMKTAGFEGNFTTHSLRSTAATRMFQAGLNEKVIMKVTGHRSEKGLATYKRVSSEQESLASSAIQSMSSIELSERSSISASSSYPKKIRITTSSGAIIDIDQ